MKNKKLKLFNIALIGDSITEGRIQYYAENEKECKELFLEHNEDLDETDIWVKELKKGVEDEK